MSLSSAAGWGGKTLFLWAVFLSPLQAQIVDVFFLAGQSNASGRVSSGYSVDPCDAEVMYYYRTDGPTGSLSSSGGAFTTLGPLSNGYYGPEIAIGRGLVDAGYNPALIKVSAGATSLADDWNSRTGGALWNAWKANTTDALSDLTAQGLTVRLRGFFWLQGERDATTQSWANAYEGNFLNLTQDVPAYLADLGYDVSELVFVTGLSSPTTASYPCLATVREAQMEVMDSDPRGVWFDTADLTTSDGVHFNASSVQTVGSRFVASYGAVPEPSSAVLLALGCAALLPRQRCRIATGRT